MRIYMKCKLFVKVILHAAAFRMVKVELQSKLTLRTEPPATRPSAQKMMAESVTISYSHSFCCPQTLSLCNMYQPAVSQGGQTVFKDGNISVPTLSVVLYGPTAWLKAISLFIHGLLALAAITLAGERERKCLTEATRKRAPLLILKGRTLSGPLLLVWE